MFQIEERDRTSGYYEDTVCQYEVKSDLNRVRVEEEVKKYLKEHHEPTRTYGEWKTAVRADAGYYYSGYFTIKHMSGERYIVETVRPSAE